MANVDDIESVAGEQRRERRHREIMQVGRRMNHSPRSATESRVHAADIENEIGLERQGAIVMRGRFSGTILLEHPREA